jgi:hypothetical protein
MIDDIKQVQEQWKPYEDQYILDLNAMAKQYGGNYPPTKPPNDFEKLQYADFLAQEAHGLNLAALDD